MGRSQEQTLRFVESIAAPLTTVDQIARWDNTICTSVVGLPQRQAEYIADQIARRAIGVGLSPGGPGCNANIAVFVSGDSDAMARDMVRGDRALFAYYPENNITTLGQGALQDFIDTPRPIRWWHVARTVAADGQTLQGDASTGGISNAPTTRSNGSRLAQATRQDFERVIIIVDARRVGGAPLSALADYISLVALAQVNADADMDSFPTILSLFSAGASAPAAMTEWDLAYLDGLYHARRNAASITQQQQEISRRMSGVS